VSRAAGNHIAVFVGADHHGAHPDLPRLRDLLAELEPDSAFRVSRLDEFCRGAETTKPQVLSGELRWSYRYTWTLQGVHGTRAPLKRRNSELELWLERFAEPLAALARRSGGRDRRPWLDHAWRTLVACQFHDVIAGTVSDAVAQSVAARHDAVEATARELVRDSVRDLVRHDPDAVRDLASQRRPSLVVWNAAARPRGGITIADLTLFRRDVRIGPPSRKEVRRDRDTSRSDWWQRAVKQWASRCWGSLPGSSDWRRRATIPTSTRWCACGWRSPRRRSRVSACLSGRWLRGARRHRTSRRGCGHGRW
jgi:hypothetical protein